MTEVSPITLKATPKKKPHSEQIKPHKEAEPVTLYAHFSFNEDDAAEIVRTHKLYSTHWAGKEDLVYAVNLDITERDNQKQMSAVRKEGVIFTTPVSGSEGEHSGEVYWIATERDENGSYIPLNLVIPFGPYEDITAEDVLEVLDIPSPGYWKPDSLHPSQSASINNLKPPDSMTLKEYQEALEDIAEIKSILGENIPSRKILEKYRPQVEWYLNAGSRLFNHGDNHIARVLVWQEILASLLEYDGVTLDREAIRWSASIHDTQRENDGQDFEHGERAAQWVQSNLNHVIPPDSLQNVVDIVRWHVPPDHHTPEPQQTENLWVFKDADNLDMVRYELNTRYLRHYHTRNLLVRPAKALYALTSDMEKQNGKLFDVVLDTAQQLGLIKE